MPPVLSDVERELALVKAPPKDRPTAVGTAAPDFTAADYRRMMIEARTRQLEMTRENLLRIGRTYDAAGKAIAARIEDLPGYMVPTQAIEQAQAGALLRDIDRILSDLAADYADALDAGMLELAQAAADREAALAGMSAMAPANDPMMQADMQRTVVSRLGAPEYVVQFGRVAQGAVQVAASRYYRDGLKLSDRLYNLDVAGRKAIEDVIVQGLQEQASCQRVARDIRGLLRAAGSETPAYDAMRIARTEVVTAHREAHIASVTDPSTGALKGYVTAIGWRLSLSHPETDICDSWASYDSGLGAGNYLPSDGPSDHPHGLCYTVSVLADMPNVDLGGTAPDPDGVPESQLRYYAETVGDPAAAAMLAGRTGGA